MLMFVCALLDCDGGAELKTNLPTSVVFLYSSILLAAALPCLSGLSAATHDNILRLSNHFENETSRRLGLFTLSCLFPFCSFSFFLLVLAFMRDPALLLRLG
jgi:hypothetical protein